MPKNKLFSREHRNENKLVKVGKVVIGGPEFIVMAGPCAVENLKQIQKIAFSVKSSGAEVLRGGAWKPRSSPYSFQGLETEGLEYLKKAAEENNLLIVSEIMDHRDIPLFLENVDILQVGARNMHNFTLLKELGKINKPILLKRGMSATIDEFLHAAEYILSGGNENVILCERGIRTFETATRNTLDISAIPIVKKLSHLPIIVDPSHAAGKNKEIIPALCRAALAAGADGLLLEVHHDADNALCDGDQALSEKEFADLMIDLKKVAPVFGRKI
ncbi:MAG: 3-deoxy-7-phosphoheptulonate synthase [Patescibacteria group bacterium]